MKIPSRYIAFLLTLVTVGAFNVCAKSVLDTLDSLPARVEGYESVPVVIERMSARPLHEIEGVWQLTGDDGSVIAIERAEAGATPGAATTLYRLVVIVSSELSVRPGTVIGYATSSAQEGNYDSRLFTDRSEDFTLLIHPTRTLLQLDETGNRLTFSPTGLKLRVNWWRLLLPYLYRNLVTPLDGAKVQDGCVRIYPEPIPPLSPRYL